ncbi:MAG: diguanylate cyclase, partial [Legionella sp.]
MKEKDFKILIIDDNEAIHKDFIKTLSVIEHDHLSDVEEQLFGEGVKKMTTRFPNFQIDTALQGEEGFNVIKKAFEEGNPYALAFVDIRMPPGWDGVKTIKQIWKIDPEIQVVICTAYSDYSWEETIEELGETENLLILKKPFDSIAVRQLAFALTKKWQLIQERRDYTQMLETHVEERTSSLQEMVSVSRGTLESSADGILIMNNLDKILDYNIQLLEMFKIPQEIITQKNATAVLTHIAQQLEDPKAFLSLVAETNQNINLIQINKYTINDNSIFECYTQPYSIEKKAAGRVWSFRDITERVSLEKKLEFQAMHDSLTGLPNRVLMMDRLSQMITKAKRAGSVFAVIFFDLDRFKLINDSLGHAAGDELLKHVAQRLSNNLRKSDTLSRLGGDEFVIIIDEVKNEFDVVVVTNNLLKSFQEPFQISGQSLTVSSSAGISVYPRDGDNIGELLRNADAAMYKAKNLGNNQYQFYTAEIGDQMSQRLALENNLHEAIAKKQFEIFYQPQYDIHTKKIACIEAHIRWNHPTRGILLPIHFIPTAEETGLIIPIGDWMLQTACEQNKKWQEAGLPPMRVAVNLCSRQIHQPDLADKIKRILAKTGLSPEFLELEITENVLSNSLESSIDAIEELSKMGVHITL